MPTSRRLDRCRCRLRPKARPPLIVIPTAPQCSNSRASGAVGNKQNLTETLAAVVLFNDHCRPVPKTNVLGAGLDRSEINVAAMNVYTTFTKLGKDQWCKMMNSSDYN
jgi:hypothetical protein